MFKVRNNKCNQCLYSSNRIVSKERAKEIINDCRDDQTHFICHKASLDNEDIACRGHYDSEYKHISKYRVFDKLNIIKYVD